MFLDHIEMCKEPYMVYGPHIMTTQRHTRDYGYEQGEVSLIHGNTRGLNHEWQKHIEPWALSVA